MSNRETYTRASKTVGWSLRAELPYPTEERVRKTTDEALGGNFIALCCLLEWNRFLRSPSNDGEIAVIHLVSEGIERFLKAGAA